MLLTASVVCVADHCMRLDYVLADDVVDMLCSAGAEAALKLPGRVLLQLLLNLCDCESCAVYTSSWAGF